MALGAFAGGAYERGIRLVRLGVGPSAIHEKCSDHESESDNNGDENGPEVHSVLRHAEHS